MRRAFQLNLLPNFHRVITVQFLLSLVLFGLAGCAHDHALVRTETSAPTGAATPAAQSPVVAATAGTEQIRTGCVAGRRLICGKVLKVLPDGLVVDSGYTDLLRPQLTGSWVFPGTVSASRNPAAIELKEPGTPCIGLIFLTDIPKRPKVKNFDYVVIMGYPAGQSVYTPAPNIEKTVRRFSAGLDTAVRLRLQAEENQTGAKGP